MLKNNKGITLIALVITIIVLLILAGVSIAMLTGENGILNQASTARDDTAKAEAVERINMELNALYSLILADEGKSSFTKAELDAVNTNLNGTGCEITTPETTADNTTAVTIGSDVTGVTAGTITVTSAGHATLVPASYQ